jgi:sulfite reductase (ferredoxin)
MAAAERLVFEAQLQLDDGDFSKADDLAYNAMLQGAKALIKTEFLDVSDDPDILVKEFRERFYDTKLFRDKYAGGKFAQYLFSRHESPPSEVNGDNARQFVEEAQLFIEAAHACWERVADRQVSDPSLVQGAPSSPTGG